MPIFKVSNAPAGAAVNPTTGIFTWKPTEAQGPGTYPITNRVTGNGSPPRSNAKTFKVFVREVDETAVAGGIVLSNSSVFEFVSGASIGQLSIASSPTQSNGAEGETYIFPPAREARPDS